MEHLLFFAIGSLTGFLSGLLGISGGFLTVPLLFFTFTYLGLDPQHLMQLAIGTSLAAMVFNTFISVCFHQRQKTIEWPIVKRMLPFLLVGSILGSLTGHLLPTTLLRITFGLSACLFGSYLYLHAAPPIVPQLECKRPTFYVLSLLIGSVSTILGIGGGTLTVPFFLSLNIPMHRTVATSAATGFCVTFIGAIGYFLMGFHDHLYPHTLGDIYLPAFFNVAIGACLLAPLGAKLTYSLRSLHLKRIFSLFLGLVGLAMLLH